MAMLRAGISSRGSRWAINLDFDIGRGDMLNLDRKCADPAGGEVEAKDNGEQQNEHGKVTCDQLEYGHMSGYANGIGLPGASRTHLSKEEVEKS